MTKIYIENLPESLENGVRIFLKKYDAMYGQGEVTLKLQMSANDKVGLEGNIIYYKKYVDIFRYLVKWIHAYRAGKQLSYFEKRQFHTFGIMLDFSRNAIMHVQGVKEYINYLAGFGADRILLYLEDTYEVKEYPYMGYFRGRYTAQELKEIDEYAALFGIETIACIQTLGHMARFLRWHKELRDNQEVLLVDAPETYDFIEKCIATIAENISSPYIHIGMDEAFGLGKGAYKARFGEADGGELFVKHLKKVAEICKKYEKRPVIWGDMIPVLFSEGKSCFDENAEVKEELAERLPDVEIVYWDYYSISQKHYDDLIHLYEKCQKKIWFAGGIWTWETMTYSAERTSKTTDVALKSCKENNIQDIFATSWSNGTALCPHIAGLFGAALWARYVFEADEGDAYDDFLQVTGVKGECFEYLTKLDAPTVLPMQNLAMPDQQPSSAAMSFLFSGILCGLFDNVTQNVDLRSYYADCAEKIADFQVEPFKLMFDHYENLARALSLKANLGNDIYDAYHRGDKAKLTAICEDVIPRLISCTEKLIVSHRNLWNAYNKPFGFEVIRNYYAGVIADAYDSAQTIREYLSGDIPLIMQLEEPRLDYKHDFSQNETGFISDVYYNKIYTTARS